MSGVPQGLGLRLHVSTDLTQSTTRRERTNFDDCTPPAPLGRNQLPTRRTQREKSAIEPPEDASPAPAHESVSAIPLAISVPEVTCDESAVYNLFARLTPFVDSSLLGRVRILIISCGSDAKEILTDVVPRMVSEPKSLCSEALKNLEHFCISAGKNALQTLKVVDEVAGELGRDLSPLVICRMAAEFARRIEDKPVEAAKFCQQLVRMSGHIDDSTDSFIGGFANGIRLWESWKSDHESTAAAFLEFRRVPGLATGLFVRGGLVGRAEDAIILYRTAAELGKSGGSDAVTRYFDAIEDWTPIFGEKHRPQCVHIFAAFHLQGYGATCDRFFTDLIAEFGGQRIKNHLVFLRGAITRAPERVTELGDDLPHLSEWSARIPTFTGKMDDRLLNYVLLGLSLNIHDQRNPIKKDEARFFATWKDHVGIDLPPLYDSGVKRTFTVTVRLPEDEYTILKTREKEGREKLLATLFRICRPASFTLFDTSLQELRKQVEEVELDPRIRGTPKEMEELFVAAARKPYSASHTRENLKWVTRLVMPFLPDILGTELPELPLQDHSIPRILELQKSAADGFGQPFPYAQFRRHFEAWIPLLNVALVLMLQKAGVARSVIDDIKEFSPLIPLKREIKNFVPKSYRTFEVPVTIIAARTTVDAFHDDMTHACLDRMGSENQIKRGDLQPARVVVDWPASVSHLVGRPKGKDFKEIVGCWYSGVYPTVLKYKPYETPTYHIVQMGGGVMPHYEEVFDRVKLYDESLKVFGRWTRVGRHHGRALAPEILSVLGDPEAFDRNLNLTVPRDQWYHGWRTGQDDAQVELVRTRSGTAHELYYDFYVYWPYPNPDFGPAKYVTKLRVPSEDPE